MKFIYAMTEQDALWFKENGFRQIGSSIVNGSEAIIFENLKDKKIPDNLKFQNIMWSNKLMFGVTRKEEKVGDKSS